MTAARARTGAFVAGVLCANSIPHLATAVAGRRHLTPIGGPRSSHRINAVWGAANLVGGLALVARGVHSARDVPGEGRWDSRLVAFDLGAAMFAVWMAGSEAALRGNWDADPAPPGPRS
ncbi:hypothetical protein [Brachybacterium fresconis]|uniref:Uncharacterized protein n=1 Tax=Brachybacterium fresconis TaxID=173363 RepID=A0ABS4YHX5_9MICO|nr:hypothetical protein [Brachybacterium fresconis]MBP2408399.1 hypothetical protein [Brachybacterium fresconis]